MEKEGKYSKILTIRIDPKLLEELRKEVESKDMDLSDFVRGCLRTGMYLHEMNTALRSRRRVFTNRNVSTRDEYGPKIEKRRLTSSEGWERTCISPTFWKIIFVYTCINKDISIFIQFRIFTNINIGGNKGNRYIEYRPVISMDMRQ
jgi:hypothetical protein